MTPRAVEMVPILHPAFARVRIANEIRMQFRRERKSGQTVSLQETLEADGDSALTLADVIQDGFCMEDSCERQEDVRQLRQLLASFMREFAQRGENRRLHIYTDCNLMD